MKKLLVWSAVHFGVMLLSMLFAAHRLEDDPSVLEQGATLVAGVLMQPGLSVWAWLGPVTQSHDALEWVVMFANSMLWGAMLIGLQVLLSSRRRS
jgi:hypothetical protein